MKLIKPLLILSILISFIACDIEVKTTIEKKVLSKWNSTNNSWEIFENQPPAGTIQISTNSTTDIMSAWTITNELFLYGPTNEWVKYGDTLTNDIKDVNYDGSMALVLKNDNSLWKSDGSGFTSLGLIAPNNPLSLISISSEYSVFTEDSKVMSYRINAWIDLGITVPGNYSEFIGVKVAELNHCYIRLTDNQIYDYDILNEILSDPIMSVPESIIDTVFFDSEFYSYHLISE